MHYRGYAYVVTGNAYAPYLVGSQPAADSYSPPAGYHTNPTPSECASL